RVLMDPAVNPITQGGLDEAFSLAMSLGAVGPGEFLSDPQRATALIAGVVSVLASRHHDRGRNGRASPGLPSRRAGREWVCRLGLIVLGASHDGVLAKLHVCFGSEAAATPNTSSESSSACAV